MSLAAKSGNTVE